MSECLLISTLPGKVMKKLIDDKVLAWDSTNIREAKPGKPDINRFQPGILIISLPICSLFKLAIMR